MKSLLGQARSAWGAIRRLRTLGVPDESNEATTNSFRERLRQLEPSRRVVEFGTRRADEKVPTYVHCLCPQIPRDHYLLVDARPGIDVDEVQDIHSLPDAWTNRFDALIAIAVFEHLERPWIAAREIARVLAPGGFCFISTHQTYVLHGHPSDFFRFSREALTLIFEDAGLEVVEASYRYRTSIVVPRSVMGAGACRRWNLREPSYLIVELIARKPA